MRSNASRPIAFPITSWRSLRARAARVLAVVDMNRTKTLDAQNPVEFLEHPIKVVDNVISGIVHMAGI